MQRKYRESGVCKTYQIRRKYGNINRSKQYNNRGFIYLILGEAYATNSDNDGTFYLYVKGFKYYTGWKEQSLSMHDNPKQYIECKPILYGKDKQEEYEVLKNIAISNKEYIGQEYGEKLKHFSPYHHEYNEIYRQIVNFKTKESK